MQSWEDAESQKGGFGLDAKSLRKVFDEKTKIVQACVDRWPKFATYEEDRNMCSAKYTESYKGHRPIFWDMTNLPVPKPSNAEMQRLTYSSYYGMNCFNGSVMFSKSP